MESAGMNRSFADPRTVAQPSIKTGFNAMSVAAHGIAALTIPPRSKFLQTFARAGRAQRLADAINTTPRSMS
jgi:hypothetical protein